MEYTDQLSRSIRLDAVPKRIVSLVPSQTEFLYDLGLADEVIGITKFCIHPEQWFRTKQRIGGTKNVDLEVVRNLQPDLIIANKEENERTDIEALEQIAPVWISDIVTLDDAYEMMEKVGELVGKQQESAQLVSAIKHGWKEVYKLFDKKSVVYYIWHNPDMVAGSATFIDEVLNHLGLVNCVKTQRYPEFECHSKTVDYVFLSSEPYPFKGKHVKLFEDRFENAQVLLVDGEMFSWYGSRMKLAPDYFKGLADALLMR